MIKSVQRSRFKILIVTENTNDLALNIEHFGSASSRLHQEVVVARLSNIYRLSGTREIPIILQPIKNCSLIRIEALAEKLPVVTRVSEGFIYHSLLLLQQAND